MMGGKTQLIDQSTEHIFLLGLESGMMFDMKIHSYPL